MPNLHYGEMKAMARMKPTVIAAKYGLTEYKTKEGKRFWYRDNGAKVLFVGHTDTVQPNGVFQPVKFKSDTWIFSPTHDDRLGLHVGLDYLTKCKLKFDILLTDDEEKGKSTALWFDPPKKYNWMFMFDRKGTGAVTYQYSTEQLRYKLGKYNFETSWGGYSCIRDLEHLGCSGINFGVGYHNNHSENAYASVNELRSQLRKFVDFFKEYQYVRMPHEAGYQRFAEAVNYNSWDYRKEDREINSPYIGPRRLNEKLDESYGNGNIINAEFEVIEDGHKGSEEHIIMPQEEQWPYTDYGDFLRENRSVSEVTPEGKLLFNRDRDIGKLYHDVTKLKVSPVLPLVLKNHFNIHKVIDLVQQSKWKLAMSKWFSIAEVSELVTELKNIGFGMPYNVQGFMTSKQWIKCKEYGDIKRGKTLLGPEPTNARLVRISKEKAKELTTDKKQGFYGDWKKKKAEAIKAKKFIVLHPLPLPPEREAEMFETTRDLIKSGYTVETHYICQNCKKDKIFDIQTTDRLPELCGNCLAKGVDSSPPSKEPELPFKEEVSHSTWDKENAPVWDSKEVPNLKVTVSEKNGKTYYYNLDEKRRARGFEISAYLAANKTAVPEVLLEASNATGADVFTKILLNKKETDETQFEFIGKANGKGADKYAWSKPGGEQTLEVKRNPVGFTHEQE